MARKRNILHKPDTYDQKLEAELLASGMPDTCEYRESYLSKIHFKRNNSFSTADLHEVCKTLAVFYLNSNDVRFFNEYLWFSDNADQDKNLRDLVVAHFHNQLTSNATHPFPISEDKEHTAHLNDLLKKTASAPQNYSQGNIALLGSPTFFTNIYKKLTSCGFNVKCFFIPHHQNSKVRLLFKNRLAFFIYRILKGCHIPYQKLAADHSNISIGNELEKHNLNVGFHKLGFIIKPNIINAFKTGLINDHWGLLPYIRGRSSIEFSLLCGVPLATTSHLVESTIDTGPIVACHSYEQATKLKSVSAIKKVIRSETDKRAAESIKILSSNQKPIAKNNTSKGLTFYSMHPALVKYIDTIILS
ncbi:hypothetical protein D0S45_00480 [Marinifilum sp. JC120]|nr:hypothetical protein D0S45_00480 [Marinifilum sp. JC120]